MVGYLENSIPHTIWGESDIYTNMQNNNKKAKMLKTPFKKSLLQNYQNLEKIPLKELDDFNAFWD